MRVVHQTGLLLESLVPFAAEHVLGWLRPLVVAKDDVEPEAVHYTHARVIAPGVCEVLTWRMWKAL